jgi:hypothetical protein
LLETPKHPTTSPSPEAAIEKADNPRSPFGVDDMARPEPAAARYVVEPLKATVVNREAQVRVGIAHDDGFRRPIGSEDHGA